jgi:hypothetical protein
VRLLSSHSRERVRAEQMDNRCALVRRTDAFTRDPHRRTHASRRSYRWCRPMTRASPRFDALCRRHTHRGRRRGGGSRGAFPLVQRKRSRRDVLRWRPPPQPVASGCAGPRGRADTVAFRACKVLARSLQLLRGQPLSGRTRRGAGEASLASGAGASHAGIDRGGVRPRGVTRGRSVALRRLSRRPYGVRTSFGDITTQGRREQPPN